MTQEAYDASRTWTQHDFNLYRLHIPQICKVQPPNKIFLEGKRRVASSSKFNENLDQMLK